MQHDCYVGIALLYVYILYVVTVHVGGAGTASGEGTSGETAGTDSQREGEEGEREEEENRGEEMESQNASVAEATGEELTTPMEEGSSNTVSGEATNLAPPPPPPLLAPAHEQPQQESSPSPVPSPGQYEVYVLTF